MSDLKDFLGFNPTETDSVESMENRPDPLPDGSYKMCANIMKRQNNKTKDGWFWYVEYVALGGEYDGRKVVFRFNIVNKNEQAERIGRGQMKRFLECINVLNPQNEDDMIGVPLLVTLKVDKNSFTNDKGKKVEFLVNEIVRFDPYTVGTGETAKAPQAETKAAASSAPASDEAPWG